VTNTQTPNRLHRQMADVVALEAAIEQALGELIPEVSNNSEVTAVFKDFRAMTQGHLQALTTRLQTVSDVPIPDTTGKDVPHGDGSDGYPVSTALQTIYVAFSQAVIGYSTLQTLARRFRDSWLIGDENTAALVKLHTANYVGAIQQISRLVHDAVLQELDDQGLECDCNCPSCGLGVCLCAESSRKELSDAWAEAGPVAVDERVYVHPPRKGSAAATAGLRSGDVILTFDGQEIQSYPVLQTAVLKPDPGEQIQLHVRRGSGESEDVALVLDIDQAHLDWLRESGHYERSVP